MEKTNAPLKLLFLLLVFIAGQNFVACQTKDQRADATFNKCQELRDKEKTQEAIVCLEDFVKLNPERGFTYFLLSEDYRKLNQVDKAEKAITYFVALYPLNAGGHESYCRLMEEKGNLSKAFEECSTAISLDNKSSANWITMASVQEKRGDLARAKFSYKNALEIEPKNEAALLFFK